MLVIIMTAVLGHAVTIQRAPATITGFLTEFAGHRYLTLLCRAPRYARKLGAGADLSRLRNLAREL